MHFNPFTFGAAGSLASSNTNPLFGGSVFGPRAFDSLGAIAAAKSTADGDAPGRLAAGWFAPRSFAPALGDAGARVVAGAFSPHLCAQPHIGDLAARIAGQIFGPREWRFAQGYGLGTLSGAAGIDITGLTATDAALDDYVPIFDTSASANRKLTPERLLALLRINPGGRLTMTTGTPVVTSPGTSSTVYYTPYLHDIIVLWDSSSGGRWIAKQFTEMSLALSGLTTLLNYDVFCYLNSGTPTLEKLAWTDGTTRATAITIQDGRYCKSGDKTRLYLGTLTAASATTTALTNSVVLVWNMYNRVRRYMYVQETADSWTYSTATWRSMNNSTGNRLQFVCGLPEDSVTVETNISLNPGAGGGAAVGIGLDRTNGNDAQTTGYQSVQGAGTVGARWTGTVTGYHFVQAIEYGQAGTPTFYGDAGAPTFIQSAIMGEVWC